MNAVVRKPSTYLGLTLAAGLHATAVHSPARPAIVVGERALTYGELSSRTRRVAGGAVAALGRTHGERAVILAPNCIEYPEIICGLSDVGVVVSTANPRLTAWELEVLAADCEPRMLFVHPSLESLAATASLPSIEKRLVLGAEYEAWLSAQVPRCPIPELSEIDPFALVYTAGTTGTPKGVVLSHRSRAMTFFGMAMEYGCFGPDDRHLSIAPMAHGAGFAFTMAPLFFGAFVEVLEKFDPELVLDRLGRGEHTGIFMVPTHYQTIFGLEQRVLERHRGTTPRLRAIISNACALPQAVKEKIIGYWGEGLLHETYGSTEGGIVSNLRPAEQLTKVQCVGRPFSCTEVMLLDDEGRPVVEGEVGELYSRSPFLFNGYYRRPEDTAACIRDGCVSVGDLAWRDGDGCIYIVDRKTDMVISGGLNIYPREIEEVLHKHPGIREAAVIGVPDDRWGEKLQAFIVTEQGYRLDADAIDTHCRQWLGGYKMPRSVQFIDSLPRNAAGKVLKQELRNV